ncbi:MAG TPA: NusA-like transcription termination signal-binding factor [Candidatus Diapherotrites archaeon]|uniref:NusA-like transcription termination signal-binding factor n=1 Tax=Candidatus Iainarchaeum sp. TaxID=3101447 RepID=A0A7J4IWL5_9ARCH|nr:NusA-like transcription termination signal-binding factor [Candidatus Diapherotrites archaeon]
MKLSLQQIQLINALDSIARVGAKDCFIDGESIVYLVPESQMRQAIGKSGSTVELIKKKLGKRVELFEFTESAEKFFEKAFFKAKIDKVEIKDMKERKVAIVQVDNTNKKIILQNMRRLKRIKELAKRNYSIDEVRIR